MKELGNVVIPLENTIKSCKEFSECLFDGFADVAVSGSDTRHQDLLSAFTLVFSGLLRVHLEHDLEEVSDVSQKLDPAVENGQKTKGIQHEHDLPLP